MPRRAGVLLHPTSFAGPYGIGDIGPAAHRFLEWLEGAGQRLWQVLPLGPTGMGNSPYGPLSAFAGNPLLVSPELLAADGLVSDQELAAARAEGDRVDFDAVRERKERLLRAAWGAFERGAAGELESAYEAFLAAPEQRGWLADWALYAALKQRFEGADWMSWPRPERLRDADAVRGARRELAAELRYHGFVQFLFARQWGALRDHAVQRRVEILGDVPIYVAADSVDAWANRSLFDLDDDGRPRTVAGVPPDYFSDTGQLWGNPLYDWERLEATGYAWWVKRIAANLRRFDVVRIDHFRGLAGYWAVDAGAETAEGGSWLPGPGKKLFDALSAELGELPLVAEDLGVITPDVEELLAELGMPGMRVLQFAFDEPDNQHAPHNVPKNAVFYTGTHDNDTARGWFAGVSDDEKRGRALTYLGADGGDIHWDLLRAAWTSPADTAICPVQDLLGLGGEARMNTPGVGAGNWGWRLWEGALTEDLGGRLRWLTDVAGRIEPAPGESDEDGSGSPSEGEPEDDPENARQEGSEEAPEAT